MTSYQHSTDTSRGEYQSIGNGVHPSEGGKKKKWTVVGVLVVLAVILGVSRYKPAGASTRAAIKKSGLPLNEDGSVKLFDNLSKL